MPISPEQTLRDRIVAALRSKGHLSEAELQKLEKKYLSGKVTGEDWVMHVESSMGKEESDGKAN